MDRSWMYKNRTSFEFSRGVDEFVKAALEYKSKSRLNIVCPCCDCNNARVPETIDELRDHLIRRGFKLGYTRWTWHGEQHDIVGSSSTLTTQIVDSLTGHEDGDDDSNGDDDGDDVGEGEEMDRISDMLHDVEDKFTENPQMFESILEASKKEMYPGCVKYTVLSYVITLFNLKTRHNVSDEFYNDLLEKLADMFPDGNTLPTTTYKAKKLMCPMGLEYEKIHACPKDCVLFRNEYADMETCPRCASSRYKKKKGVPAKVVWYLPIIPRFKRLFSDEKNAKLLKWHHEVRKKDEFMRHPADSPQWRQIDVTFPEFGGDARNLRLGLCTDGMNPFGTLRSQYSTWPVILTIYNLPPWLCMKRKYLMLSLLISGPKQFLDILFS